MKGVEIKDFVFDKGAFGYKVDDVTNCLKDISQYVISLEDKISEYEKKIKELKDQVESYKNDEESVKEIIYSAQKFKTNIINEAKEKANEISESIEKRKLNFDAEIKNKTEELISDAKSRADDIMRDTQHKFESEARHLRIIKKEVSDFKARLLSLYKSHLDIITKIPEYESEELIQNNVKEKSVIDNDDDNANMSISDSSSDDKIEKAEDNDDAKMSADDKNEHGPVFKVTLTNNDENVDKGDYIKSRFSELKFGGNNN